MHTVLTGCLTECVLEKQFEDGGTECPSCRLFCFYSFPSAKFTPTPKTHITGSPGEWFPKVQIPKLTFL